METKFEYSLHQCMWYHMAFWDCDTKGDFLANLSRILSSGHVPEEFKKITVDDIHYYLHCKNLCIACSYAYNISTNALHSKACECCPLVPIHNIVHEMEKYEDLFIEWYTKETYVRAKTLLSYMWEEREKVCLNGLFDIFITLLHNLEETDDEKVRAAKNIVAYLISKLEPYPHVELAEPKWKER